MSFGFGALPGFANMRPEDVASLFSGPSASASQGFGVLPAAPAGFSGSVSRGIAPFGALPAPQVAMDEAETQRLEAGMLPPAAASLRMPAPPIRPASLPARAAAEAPAAAGGMMNPPLPPARPPEFGSSADPAPTAAPAAPAGEPPSMMDRFLGGIKSGLGGIDSDLLMGLGVGLMSQRGFGPAAASGLQMGMQMQNSRAARDLAGAKQAVELQKLRQAQGNTQQMASLIQKQNPSLSAQEAMALASNPAYANKAAEALLPPNEQYVTGKDDAGNLIQRNTRTGQTTMLQAAKDGGFTIGENQIRYNDQGQVIAQGTGVGSDKDARDREQRRQAVLAAGQDPNEPRWRDYIITSSLPKETQQQLTAGDKKVINEAEDQIPLIDQTIGTLDRARELNRQTFTGATAGIRGKLGTSIPGASYLLDPKASEATREFNQIMSMEAIKSMSSTLKGATTDTEMARFMDILGDPATPPDIRERTIDRMRTLAERQKDLAVSRINDMKGGNYYKAGGTSAAMGRQPSAPAGGVARPASQAEYDALAKGTQFMDPNGDIRIKP